MLTAAIVCAVALNAPRLTLAPFGPVTWAPDGGDARWLQIEPIPDLETNGQYVRPPQPGVPYDRWLAAMRRLRRAARSGNPPTTVRFHYRGVRAWVRVRPELGGGLDLRPGERVHVDFAARWRSGNPEICFSVDQLDRVTHVQRGWSGVLTTARIPTDGAVHRLAVDVTVPSDTPTGCVSNLIIGQDSTRSADNGLWELSDVRLTIASTSDRTRAIEAAHAALAAEKRGLDRSNYDRADLRWSSSDFTCYFAFLYDTAFLDPATGRFRIDAWLDETERAFGKIDSVVLWHAYPRIGVDQRNQFDFYRDMPGGLEGLKRVVDRLHARGVRAFIDYNPWDTGTRREPGSDTDALAGIVKAIGADCVFLDTMMEAPAGLRAAVDRVRPGVTIEPEGNPPIEQLSLCNASWAQGFTTYPEPGILEHKWTEPRHMQHQIRRWDHEHTGEIEEAFFNGSGMLVWENIFGTYNPWTASDRALWRHATPILHAFAPELASERWMPSVPTLVPGVYANRWDSPRATLYLLVNRQKRTVTEPVLRLDRLPREARVYDLWRGEPVTPDSEGRVAVPLDHLGAIAVARNADGERAIAPLLGHGLPQIEANDPRIAAQPLTPRPIVRTEIGDAAAQPPGMVPVPGGPVHMLIHHERRECGCYPDPGTPSARERYFTFGDPFPEIITHDHTATVAPFLIDQHPVSNAQYAAFLAATGYRPRDATNFLKHWPDGRCPEAIRDEPVVYVDLDDARAYARWANKRLPNEPEWHQAATLDSRLLTPDSVFNWTESERDDGHTRFTILRGSSAFDAPGSIWYVHGGPQPLDAHTKFILLYPGLDRCATIGFRCVKDAR